MSCWSAHNPNLPQFLASLILNGAATPGRGAIRLRKGAVARVDLTRRPGMLHWLVDPRILRGVYGKAPKPTGKLVKKPHQERPEKGQTQILTTSRPLRSINRAAV